MTIESKRVIEEDNVTIDLTRGAAIDMPGVHAPGLLRSPQVRATLTLVGSSLFVVVGGSLVWLIGGGRSASFVLLAAFLSVAAMFARGVFVDRMVPDMTSMIPRIVGSVGMAVMAALAIEAVVPTVGAADITATDVLAVVIALAGLALLGQAAGLMILRRRWGVGRGRSRAAIVGTTDLALEFAIEIKHHTSYGVDVVGFVESVPVQQSLTEPVLGALGDLPDIVAQYQIDRLIVMPGAARPLSQDAIKMLRWASVRRGLTTHIVPRFYELGMGLDSLSPDRVRGYPLLRLNRSQQREFGLAVKRAFDLGASLAGLLVLSPLLLITTVLVKVSSAGPVLFRQERVGKDGKTFEVVKFRTMRESDASDTEWMGEAEQRVTPIGNFLRKSSIDELPQLLNIVKGEMSLVGPRPERPAFVEQFAAEIPDYSDRHRMQVGLTGLSQIVGLRGDTPISERAKYDNIYIDQWSFTGDLQILFKTAWAIVRANRYAESASEIESALKKQR